MCFFREGRPSLALPLVRINAALYRKPFVTFVVQASAIPAELYEKHSPREVV
jgi:hypothetical protein